MKYLEYTHVVDVEARVNLQYCLIKRIEHIARVCFRGIWIWKEREGLLGWREFEVRIQV